MAMQTSGRLYQPGRDGVRALRLRSGDSAAVRGNCGIIREEIEFNTASTEDVCFVLRAICSGGEADDSKTLGRVGDKAGADFLGRHGRGGAGSAEIVMARGRASERENFGWRRSVVKEDIGARKNLTGARIERFRIHAMGFYEINFTRLHG